MAKVQAGRSRLGRGLSSLLSSGDLPVQADVSGDGSPLPAAGSGVANGVDPIGRAGVPLEVPVSAVQPNPFQPRRQFDEAALQELAASLKSTGLIQPIVVRQTSAGYELVSGERRLRAAKAAGLETIPAFIRELDRPMQAQMALVENTQRADLNPLERAEGYRQLMQQLGLTQAELATRLGEDRSSVANYLRLLDLAEPVKAAVRTGTLSLGHAKILAGVPDVLEQERLANVVIAQQLTVRNLERLLADGAGGRTVRQPAEASAHLTDLERSLSRQLGMRVQIKSAAKKGKGRLVLHYANLDQFDQLLSKLNVQVD